MTSAHSVQNNTPSSTVYGPVDSWRVGRSLGIDVLFTNSICSFRCIYCQLGKIQLPTRDRQVWVSTARILEDLEASDWRSADIITFSGSGEPTLALNLGEVIRAVRERTGKPIAVLTNATLLDDSQVREDLQAADKIFCKLDAAQDSTLQLIDRPVDGITLETIVSGIQALRAEYQGFLAIQSMWMPANLKDLEAFASLVERIQPDEVQLNTPTRPVPRAWFLAARGNYTPADAPYEAVPLKHLNQDETLQLRDALQQLTTVPISSVFKPS
jgi:wyosine [tRNA(Phe)-imidazoG37] synthetase (radical SAM superfamily)